VTRLKDLERGFKAFAIRSLGRVMGGGGQTTAATIDWARDPQRILYLRYDRIGDMVLATGIIRAIKTAQPTVTIDVLASPANARVLLNNPYVNQVLTFDKRRRSSYLATVAAMRRGKYDAVIDAMVMAPSLTTMMLMWASGAKHRIGVGDRGNEYALTMPVPRMPGALHYVDNSAALLAAFGPQADRKVAGQKVESGLGNETEGAMAPSSGWDIWRPEIFLSTSEREGAESAWRRAAEASDSGRGASGSRPAKGEGGGGGGGDSRERRLVVNVSAGAPGRYWPEERFIGAIDRITARFPGTVTLVIGAPQDAERMQKITAASRSSVAITPDYRQMMAIVATADAALTADTSVTHIASAFGTPAVVMCARGLASLYGPYGTKGLTVSTVGRGLDSLETEPVVTALTTVLAASGSRAQASEAGSHR
jgi:ADP-heptose:LPS heptosyltransferase